MAYNAAVKRAYYLANREEIIAAVRGRNDPEAKRAYDRAHNARPDVKAKRAAQRRAWRQRNRDKVRAHDRERSLVRRDARPDADGRAYIAILLRDPCCYCGRGHEHVDHIVPLVAGGDSCWGNLTSACERCNQAKRDKPLLFALLSHPHNGGY